MSMIKLGTRVPMTDGTTAVVIGQHDEETVSVRVDGTGERRLSIPVTEIDGVESIARLPFTPEENDAAIAQFWADYARMMDPTPSSDECPIHGADCEAWV